MSFSFQSYSENSALSEERGKSLTAIVPHFAFEYEAARWVSVPQTKSYCRVGSKGLEKRQGANRFRLAAIKLLNRLPLPQLLYLS